MPNRLKHQVAIVTGAADGIGTAIAKLFSSEGAAICVADVNAQLGKQCVLDIENAGGQAVFVHTDVSDNSSVCSMVAQVVKQLGPPEILINNAGIIPQTPDPLATEDETWDRMFRTNLDGMWYCARAVVPHMQAKGAGSIVNLGSVHSFQIVKGHFPYAVTKHAVVGLTRTLAVELGQHNIRVNALCPGMVETPAAFEYFAKSGDGDAARQAIAALHPLGRNSSTEEMAYPALFLASSESSFMTGQALIVDGGRSAVYHD